jgi:NADH-quinone oxidoreductase subunit H
MSLGWKFMLPLALAYIVIIAVVSLALDAAGVARGPLFGLILFGMNIVLCALVFVGLDRGRLISPASSRARLSEVERLRAVSRGGRPLAASEGVAMASAARLSSEAGD